jgi:hypothetical protein
MIWIGGTDRAWAAQASSRERSDSLSCPRMPWKPAKKPSARALSLLFREVASASRPPAIAWSKSPIVRSSPAMRRAASTLDGSSSRTRSKEARASSKRPRVS